MATYSHMQPNSKQVQAQALNQVRQLKFHPSNEESQHSEDLSELNNTEMQTSHKGKHPPVMSPHTNIENLDNKYSHSAPSTQEIMRKTLEDQKLI